MTSTASACQLERASGELGAAALAYASQGLPVIPLWWPLETGDAPVCACRAPRCNIGKHPRTEHWRQDASTDPAIVRAWWKRWPLANVGLVMGPPAGMWALDVDPLHRGDVALVDLVRDHGPLGDSLHAITGSGGDHYFFRWPAFTLTNSARSLPPGLDVRGDGGYVVAAPSLHPSGYRYAWGPARVALDAPPWLLALLAPPALPASAPAPAEPQARTPTPGRRSPEERAAGLLRTMPPAVQGQRGQWTMYRAALAVVRGFALDTGTALRLMVEIYNPRCRPPWKADEEVEIERAVQKAATTQDPRAPAFGSLLSQDSAAWTRAP